MTAVIIGEKNKKAFRDANASLTERVWKKLERAGAVKSEPNAYADPTKSDGKASRSYNGS